MSNLLYTETEQDLRASVRALLTDRCPPENVLARCESDKPYDLDLWHTLAAEVGVAALLIAEEFGGYGATAREAAVVLEELGRFVAPVPFLGSAVLATTALLGCQPTEEITGLLGRLSAGESTAALALPLSTAPGACHPTVRVADGTLHGQVTSVADALVAHTLIVPVATPDGMELHLVDVADQHVTVSPVVSLDLTRPVSDIELTGAASTRLAGADRAERAVDTALRTGAALLASEQLGLAEWCLDSTVSYLRDRHQFGRVVGSFQALKHRMADMWESLVAARAAARYAADTLATGDPDGPVAASVAQALCAVVAVHNAEECVQLHGGIGMTWEHPAHLYLKRAKADEIALGTPGQHRALLAPLVDLPGPA